jgi:HSP20 family protein
MARNPLSPFGLGGYGRGYGDPFMSLHREMNRLFDDTFRGMAPSEGGQSQGGQGTALAPHIDVSETDKEVRICAELPGVNESDVEVMLNDDVLTIRGEKKFERADQKENYHFVERSYGTFQRSLRIPYPVNPDEVQASFERGVLTVTLPKTKQQEKSRRIEVRSGTGGTVSAGGKTAGGTATASAGTSVAGAGSASGSRGKGSGGS